MYKNASTALPTGLAYPRAITRITVPLGKYTVPFGKETLIKSYIITK